jgi:hypothetical protein
VVALVASSVFVAWPKNWLGVVVGSVVIVVMAVAVTRWLRCAGWAAARRLALAGGALLTYARVGFILLWLEDAAITVSLLGQVVSSWARPRCSPSPPGARRTAGAVA